MAAFHNTTIIGGSGGYSFTLRGGTNGRVVKRFELWAMENGVKAIRVWLTSDSYSTFGVPEKPAAQGALRHQAFDFQDGELIRTLSLWGNGAGTRFGWIRFTTNKNRTFDHGMYKWGRKQEYVQTVSSGIFVGVRGNASADVDCLGLVFLTPISRMRITSVSYKLPLSGTISQQTLDTFSDTNTGTVNRKWVFSNDKNVEDAFKWELTNKSGLSLYHDVDDGVRNVQFPQVKAEVESGKAKFSWELSANTTLSSISTSLTRNLDWYASGTMAPNQSVRVSAVTGKGSISTTFTAYVQVDVPATSFSYAVDGKYTGTNYSNAVVV